MMVAVVAAYESDSNLIHHYSNMEAFPLSIATVNNVFADFVTLFVIGRWLTLSARRALPCHALPIPGTGRRAVRNRAALWQGAREGKRRRSLAASPR